MITLKEALLLQSYSIRDFGGNEGIRDKDLLESALERPSATFGGEELYHTTFAKAAAILESILKNHPFVDGNKRTGWLVCIVVLRCHDYKFIFTQEEAYDFVIKVASTHTAFEEIVDYIEANVERINL